MWLVVPVCESAEARQNTATLFIEVYPYTEVGINVDTKVAYRRKQVTMMLLTNSAYAGNRCWQRLVAHRMTSVFEEFT